MSTNTLISLPKRKPQITVEKAPKRKAPTVKQVLDVLFIFQDAKVFCADCGARLVRSNIQLDHRGARELGGSDEPENMRFICTDPCHAIKTRKDIAAIAKGKRIRGETKKSMRPKAQIKSPGFQTGRDSKFKSKFGGGAIERKAEVVR